MCGFSLALLPGAAQVDAVIIERMTAAIRHRGPDDEGRFFSGPIAMGFRRLSILDMSPLGHQPMSSADGHVTLVFNGEIYNYVELRGELEGLGHRFKSSGDTEVLLAAYCQWGADCVEKLNGMWAFVLYDRKRNLLFGSRDRFGIKPLYRYSDGRYTLLASEIKSIRASGVYHGGTNWQIASRYLVEGRLDETPETFYSGVTQIPPGYCFELTLDGGYKQWPFWSLENLPPSNVRDPAASFAELFEDAVRLHMRSDVPVGVHLSGGLDSTSIICASARLRSAQGATEPLLAFSYITPEFDESRYIRDTIEQTAATLVKLNTTPVRLWDTLREVLGFQDEPMHTMTPLVGYELMRLTAGTGVKVILNGQGADETLAGYSSYFRECWRTLLQQGRFGSAWDEMGKYVAAHGGSQKSLFVDQLRYVVQAWMTRIGPYRKLRMWRRLQANNASGWFKPELLSHHVLDEEKPITLDLNRQLAYSVYHDPLPLYLRIEDRNSMAHSIEARLPFLDYRLVSFAFGLPENWRIRGPWNKFVLREAMRNRIPESVRARIDKMGFPVPGRSWFADTLAEPVLDTITSRAARERGIYNTETIVKDIDRHRRGEIDVSDRIFRTAQHEVWCGL